MTTTPPPEGTTEPRRACGCADDAPGHLDRPSPPAPAAEDDRPDPVVPDSPDVREVRRSRPMVETQRALTALSEWIDAGNARRDPEALHLHRVIKVGEEAGEVVSAIIGWLGANPRKGQTHTVDDVIDELLDVAVTALGAIRAPGRA